MLSPAGALLAHLSLAVCCWVSLAVAARLSGPSRVAARRLRRAGAFLALLLAAGVGAAVGTNAHVAAWATGALSVPLSPDVAATLGTLVLFLGPVPLAAYAAYHGAETAARRAGTAHGSWRRFGRGYALAVGPALVVTALAPAVPEGWWLAVGVAIVGFLMAAGSPLLVRRLVPHRRLTEADVALSEDGDLPVPVYVLETGVDGGANALAAGLLGLRCVFVTERLLAALPAEELAAIVTHELGHHRRRHVPLRLGAVGAYVLPWLAATALDVPGAFLVGVVLFVPVTAGIFRLVRWTEYDADAYAARHVGAGPMRGALERLMVDDPDPDPAGRLLGAFALHPPMAARVTRLERLDHLERESPAPGSGGHSGD